VTRHKGSSGAQRFQRLRPWVSATPGVLLLIVLGTICEQVSVAHFDFNKVYLQLISFREFVSRNSFRAISFVLPTL
jgi:hypothetical protein